MLTDQVLLLAFVVFAGILCQWFAWWVKLPAILFLLITGIIAGPVTGVLDADIMLGDLLFPFISLSVAMILFEGSLTLKFKEIAGLQRVVRRMITFGVPVTWLITATATRYALNLPWSISFLFGSIVVVTGPTVIIPMLRTVKPKAAIANILRWESIVIDPIGATLALLVYEFIIAGSSGNAMGHTLMVFGKIVGVGLVTGSLAGWLFGSVLRSHWLPEFLHNVGTLSFVGAVFAVSNLIQHESGLLTVTIMGIWLANMKYVPMDDIIDFKESVSVLLISVLFIVLASRVDLVQLRNLGWSAAIIFIAIQFLSRPLSVMVSAWGSTLTWPERHLLAWIAPRGIVAAAISALFSIGLIEAGYQEAELLVPLTFMVIIGTVLLQSLTSSTIARILGVNEPYPTGILLIGANKVSIELGKALKENNYRPLLVDRDWQRIEEAKSFGLDTYLGEAVSEYAQRNLDLIGIGKVLAMTPGGALNALVCVHYRMELGESNVYLVKTRNGNSNDKEKSKASAKRWQQLFGSEITLHDINTILESGGGIHTAELSETLKWNDYHETFGDAAIPLFAISPEGRLHIFTSESKLSPATGWKIIGMVPVRQV